MSASPSTSHLLYLDAQAVRELGLAPHVLRGALESGFREHAHGCFVAPPKQTLSLAPGHFFQSLSVVSLDGSYALTKWVGIATGNTAHGLSNVSGVMVLSDAKTGLPLALLDASLPTVFRTAAMSALAAQYLARKDSRSLGFVGCGEQARGHLDALTDVLPALERVVAYSRTASAAEALASRAAAKGLAAIATDRHEDVMACDVIVTSVPGGPNLVPFLDGRKVTRGAFVAVADLGRSWIPEFLEVFDLKITDDAAQAADEENRKKLAYKGPFDADLSQLVSTELVRRRSAQQRVLFQFPGHALADLIVAKEIFKAALATGKGVRLAR